MGRNDEYVDELFPRDENSTHDQDQEDDGPADLDPESWHDWNSEHLLNMYMSLVDYCETQGLGFMRDISFNDFCHFIFNRAL